jgi:hypothetical protein
VPNGSIYNTALGPSLVAKNLRMTNKRFLLAARSVRTMFTRQKKKGLFRLCIAPHSEQEFRYLSSDYMPHTVVREVAELTRRTGLMLAKCIKPVQARRGGGGDREWESE